MHQYVRTINNTQEITLYKLDELELKGNIRIRSRKQVQQKLFFQVWSQESDVLMFILFMCAILHLEFFTKYLVVYCNASAQRILSWRYRRLTHGAVSGTCWTKISKFGWISHLDFLDYSTLLYESSILVCSRMEKIDDVVIYSIPFYSSHRSYVWHYFF